MNGAPIKIIQHFNSYFIILTLVYRNKNAYFWVCLDGGLFVAVSGVGKVSAWSPPT
jgi:hypothetical protein